MIGQSRRKRRSDSTAIRAVSVGRIRPSPENEHLYRPVDPNDPEIRALAQSISEHGVREPLVITEDYYILSGHRRHTAARLAGLRAVPCRTEPIRYSDCDPDAYLRLLREHNRQREKTLDEQLREEVVSADPHDAYQRLLAHRARQSDMSDRELATIALGERRDRKGISCAKSEMLQAVRGAITEREAFWPLSDRQIHYVLLNAPPLRNTRRQDSRYANDRKSYGDLCNLLTRARLCGLIPWRAIADETRPTTHWRAYASAQGFVREQLDALFLDYARNLQQSQPNHIEIIAEKLTVRSMVGRVALQYGIPVTIGRGYCSITPRLELAERFRRSGKDKLVVLLLSDFDPDGESIAESFARSMRDDFGIEQLVPIKVAVTSEQAQELNLRPSMQAKRTSAQYRKFAARFGNNVFELEAIPPDILHERLARAIESVLDIDRFNAEIERERQEAASLDEARQRAIRALRNLPEVG